MVLTCSLTSAGCGHQQPTAAQQVHFLHDLGVVLADGQPFAHTFPVVNQCADRITIEHVEAMAPCCSVVLATPAAIRPGATGAFTFAYTSDGRSGAKRVEFLAYTTHPAIPRLKFVLAVDARSAWEVVPVGPPPDRVALGEPYRREYQVTARGRANADPLLPDTLDISPALAARWLDRAQPIQPARSGLTEATRRLMVDSTGSDEPGYHSAEVRFRWTDGRTRSLPIRWEVEPNITVSPAGLALSRQDPPKEVTVAVMTRRDPFRIRSVTGRPLLKVPAIPAEPTTRQFLHLTIGPDQLEPGLAEILIATDDPHQPTIRLGVFCTSRANQAERKSSP